MNDMKRIVLLSMLCLLAASAVGQVSYAKDLDSASHARMVEEITFRRYSTGYPYIPITICDSTGCVDVVVATRYLEYHLFAAWGEKDYDRADTILKQLIAINDTLWAPLPQELNTCLYDVLCKFYHTEHPSPALRKAGVSKKSLIQWAFVNGENWMRFSVENSKDFAALVRRLYQYGVGVFHDCEGGGSYYIDFSQTQQ